MVGVVPARSDIQEVIYKVLGCRLPRTHGGRLMRSTQAPLALFIGLNRGPLKRSNELETETADCFFEREAGFPEFFDDMSALADDYFSAVLHVGNDEGPFLSCCFVFLWDKKLPLLSSPVLCFD